MSSLASGVEWLQLSSGLLQAGATRSVYVYMRGTTTQVQVYSNQGLTTTLGQPLTTDSGGNVPGYVAAEQAIDFFDALTSKRAQAEPLSVGDLIGSDGKVGGSGSLGLPASLVLVSSPNTYTAQQNYTAPLTIGGTALYGGDTKFQTNITLTDPNTDARVVGIGSYTTINPGSAAPSSLKDYHGLDLQLKTTAGNASINSNVRLYAIESQAVHVGTQALGTLVCVYGYPGVTNGGSVVQAMSYRVNSQFLLGSSATSVYGHFYDAPNMDSTSTIGAWYGSYIQNVRIGPNVGATTGTMSTATPITSIPLAAALTVAIPSGASVTVTSGFASQTFTTNAIANIGDTSISVPSTSPNFNYPNGSNVGYQPGTIGAASYAMVSNMPVYIANNYAPSSHALIVEQWATGPALYVNVQSTAGLSSYGIQVNQTSVGANHGIYINQGSSATGNGLVVTQNAANAAISVSQVGAYYGQIITMTSTATGFYGLLVTGYTHGINVTTSQNSGFALQVTKTGTGAGTAAQVVNKGTGDTMQWQIGSTPTTAVKITGLGSLVVGQGAALANAATDGFLYLPTVAGTPTGVPTAQTGSIPFAYDSTNNLLYVYNGAWKKTTVFA